MSGRQDPPTPARVDVHVQGRGVQRDTPVRFEEAGLRVGELPVPDDDVLWSSRRSGLLMLFTRRTTLAFRGAAATLDGLARELERRVPSRDRRRRLLERLESAMPLFTAATAVSGELEGERIAGLRVAVFTRQAVHLVAGAERRTLRWPVDAADAVEDERGRVRLRLVKGGSELSLTYLFEEELRTALEIATSEPPGESAPLELFARKEVAPPPRAEVPELSAAAGSLAETAEAAAEAIPEGPRQEAGLGAHFFETHFLELGEIALGPLLLRKSAASGAGSLARAVEALDGDELQEDTRAAVATAIDRMLEVYGEKLARLCEARGAPSRVRDELAVGEEERARITARAQVPFDRLAPTFRELEEEEERLVARLQLLAEGPPGDEPDWLPRVGDRWREAVLRVDRGYERAWRAALEEMRSAWTSSLLPRLARVGGMERRRVPEWLLLTLIALGTAAVVGAAVLLLSG